MEPPGLVHRVTSPQAVSQVVGVSGRPPSAYSQLFKQTQSHSLRQIVLMWQLALLGDVIPAFEVLAYEKVQQCGLDHDNGNEIETTRQLRIDVNDCYADLVLLRAAVLASHGEWKIGIDETIINRLLKALESRFYRRTQLVSFPAEDMDLTHNDTGVRCKGVLKKTNDTGVYLSIHRLCGCRKILAGRERCSHSYTISACVLSLLFKKFRTRSMHLRK